MRALVVYESVFGDARTIAQAIAEGLSLAVPADVVAAAEAPPRSAQT
jgi:menaquinone-dependent protoporphyrinogen IX oxidase